MEISREDVGKALALLGKVADLLERLVLVEEDRLRIEKKSSGEGGLDINIG